MVEVLEHVIVDVRGDVFLNFDGALSGKPSELDLPGTGWSSMEQMFSILQDPVLNIEYTFTTLSAS